METSVNKNVYKVKKDSAFDRLDPSELVFKIISYTFVIVFAILCLYPLVYCLSGAISGAEAVENGDIILWPVDVQFDAFAAVVSNRTFWIAYCSTIFITLYGTIYAMILSVLGGYALSRKNMFGNKFFNFLLIFTMWFTAGTIPMYLNYADTRDFFTSIGIADQKWTVVIAMGMAAFNIILLRNAFESVPKEINEAAIVDGANDFQIMSKIAVPMSKATIATVALFYGISRWNGYFWASRIVQNSNDQPLQVYIQSWIAVYTDPDRVPVSYDTYSEMSIVYSMIIAAIIPILIIYPFIQKYFAAGVNMGGVKE
ncbi:MAG: carbohydrate ABC transporter permease [Bacillota bacterium]|nr:carbohydrate ABC transporter permease [Bacillota bacterium]